MIRCRNWLGALQNINSEYDKNRNHLVEGTCAWILETEEFKTFVDFAQRKHLWVYGKPGNSLSAKTIASSPLPDHGKVTSSVILGAGKSVLASFVTSEMRKYPMTQIRVLHFLCKDGGQDTSSASAAAIASNLIDQLIEQNPLPSLLEILKQARKIHAKSDKCTNFEILWNIFIAMAQAFPTPIVAILDALDECLIDRPLFLDRLHFSPGGNIRFFLTSREEPDICAVLSQHGDIADRSMNVEADIEKFVIQRVEQLPRLHEFKTQVIREVTKNSAGMFRYAALLLDELNSPDSMTNIPDMLESPPKGLNGMYETILLRLESADKEHKKNVRENRKKILLWIGMAKEPLTVKALAHVCAVRDGEEKFDLTQRRLHDERELLDKCGPLIEIVGGHVQYTHLSVREFLLRSGSERSGYYLIQESEARASIAITSSE